MPRNKRKSTDVADPPVKLRRSEQIRGENAEPCSLLGLNDDCISEILLYMSEDDLLALKKSCRRLENLTEECVRRKYKDVLFVLEPTEKSHDFLREFGKVLTRMTINIWKLDEMFLHQAETFLLQEFTNLEDLSLVDVEISEDFVNQTNALCRNLKYLSISFYGVDIRNNDLRRFVLTCTKLERLSVYGRQLTVIHFGGELGLFFRPIKKCPPIVPDESISTQFLAHCYPTLKEISIRKHRYAATDYRRAHIQEFLKQNPQIEKVTFDFQKTEISSRILLDILDYSVNIKSIQIRLTEFDESFVTDVAQLHRLHNLVELNINCGFRRIGSAIGALASTNLLETLGLAETYWNDELVVALGKLTKLKTLKLHEVQGVTKSSVQRLSEVQQSLVHFHLVHDEFITVSLFVEHYPRMQTLTYTNPKMKCWRKLPLLTVEDFLEIAAARKRSNALDPLTVFLNSKSFNESIGHIPDDVLHREICYVQLKEDVELSYATQLD